MNTWSTTCSFCWKEYSDPKAQFGAIPDNMVEDFERKLGKKTMGSGKLMPDGSYRHVACSKCLAKYNGVEANNMVSRIKTFFKKLMS